MIPYYSTDQTMFSCKLKSESSIICKKVMQQYVYILILERTTLLINKLSVVVYSCSLYVLIWLNV